MVDAKYRNTKNGRVAVVIQEDLKCKTVLLQYEDDGKEQQISTSTLKRWWQELDEDDEEVDDVDDDEDLDDEDEEDFDEGDDVEEDEDALDEDGDDEEEEEEVEDDDFEAEDDEEELAGDGTPLKEVGKQIAEQAKKKAEQTKNKAEKAKPAKKHKTKPENEGNASIIEYLASAIEKRGGIVQRHQTNYGNAGSYKVDGRRFGRYRSTKADVRIYFRFSLVKSLKKPAKNYPNEPFGAEYIFTKLTKEDKKLIDSLLDLAIKTQHDTNMQRMEKKTPKKTAKKAPAKKAPVAKKTAKKN